MRLTAGETDARRLVVLAPSQQAAPAGNSVESGRYDQLLRSMQRLRGRVYLRDGAIKLTQLTADERHVVDADARSWHVLLLTAEDEVMGCARYWSHSPSVSFRNLGVSRCPLTHSDRWGFSFRYAVEQEMISARHQNLAY